ncbi:MAG: hypothetical protein M3Z26_13320 [Bacteroidota bacterium]|nr:hypothetical protein [Bacteroidota bacterium]
MQENVYSDTKFLPISINKIFKRLPSEKEYLVKNVIVNLLYDGYIKHDGDNVDDIHVTLTMKGLDARSSKYFIKENHKIFAQIARDAVLVLCNIGIAIAAIYALGNSNKSDPNEIELKALQLRLDTIEWKLQKEQSRMDSSIYLKSHSQDSIR